MIVIRQTSRTALAIAVLVSAAGGALVTASVPSAAQEAVQRLKEQGFARVAIANEPPYTEVTPGGEVHGAAPDLARAVLNKLGVEEVVGSISEYGAMIPGLKANRFDLITAGLYMTPQRCAAVAYSQPQLCDAEAFAVEKGNPLNLQSFEDIAANPEAQVGVPGGGTEERLALEAGVPRGRAIVVPDGQSGIDMLQDGRIDAYALPVLSINSLLQKADNPNLAMVAPVEGTPIQCSGAAFRTDETALRDAYDEVLAQMKESGEFAEIIESYGFSADLVMKASREELCARQPE